MLVLGRYKLVFYSPGGCMLVVYSPGVCIKIRQARVFKAVVKCVTPHFLIKQKYVNTSD